MLSLATFNLGKSSLKDMAILMYFLVVLLLRYTKGGHPYITHQRYAKNNRKKEQESKIGSTSAMHLRLASYGMSSVLIVD
ncbi:MAG: hypothetical protein ACYCP1_06030 [Thermoplasmataceae archaeon]